MPIVIPRRLFLAGGLASFAVIRRAQAEPPATIADGGVIGRNKMLVVHERMAPAASSRSTPRAISTAIRPTRPT
jgi:hypothetical protein